MGRRFYQTPELLEMAAVDYFDECEIKQKRPTLTGLALALGFTRSEALMKYEGYSSGDFVDVIDWARLKVEEGLEERMLLNSAGAAFGLKNLNRAVWKDRSEQSLEIDSGPKVDSDTERWNRAQALAQKALARQGKSPLTIDMEAEAVPEEDDSWLT